MPTVKLPISSPTYRNVDDIELNDDSSRLVNAYIDEKGGTRARPGLRSMLRNPYASIGKGLYYWAEYDAVVQCITSLLQPNNQYDYVDLLTNVATRGGIADTSVPYSQDSAISGSTINGATEGIRYTFASYGTMLFFANGAGINYIDATTGLTTAVYGIISDPDAPPKVTQLIYIDGYILANSLGTNKVFFCDNLAPTVWQATHFFSAQAAPDNVIGLKVLNREIYVFGNRSLEIWEDTGASTEAPFERTPGGSIDRGCAAPHSIVLTDDGLMWLSDEHRFVRLTTGQKTIQQFSTPYDDIIDNIQDVSDCLADKVMVAGRVIHLFTFTQADLTLAFDQTTQTWSEWAFNAPMVIAPNLNSAQTSVGSFQRFIGNAYCYSLVTGQQFVINNIFQGKEEERFAGSLYILDKNYCFDDVYNFNGSITQNFPIKVQRTTGHIDNGTLKLKRCNELRVRVKRGKALADSTNLIKGQMVLRFRDNGKQNWSREFYYDLGLVGDTNFVVRTNPLGMYRTRQWEITMSDGAPFVLVDAEADIDILSH